MESNSNPTIGSKIKTLRKIKGITAKELGKAIEKDPITVYRYEQGSIKKIPYGVQVKIAEVLGVMPEFLTNDSKDYLKYQQKPKKRETDMLNIERYKDEILEEIDNCKNLSVAIMKVYETHSEDLLDNEISCLDWLCSKYVEPILSKEEKKYLSSVIAPFRNDVESIEKTKFENKGFETISVYVRTCADRVEEIRFPRFTEGTMYKNMELDRNYRLKELGL